MAKKTQAYLVNKPHSLLTSPDQLPSTGAEAAALQEANKTFWESNPMRYDWKEEVGYPEHSTEFYQEIDRRFFTTVREFMLWKKIPFDALIPFEEIRQQRVLEIGVGNGSHAQLLATYAGSFTGIDLTEYGSNSTRKRIETFGLSATIHCMDAEEMHLVDNTFDYIWTWGVIHHSSNTSAIIDEMSRVLVANGKTTIMVYHKGWWSYYIVGFFFHGLLRGLLFKTGSLHKVVQETTDGALARYYNARSWEDMVGSRFKVTRTQVMGSKAELLPIPGGRFKNILLSLIPNTIARFFTNTLRMGSFLIIDMTNQKDK